VFSVEVSTRGLEFDGIAQKLSGPLRQKLIEKLADIAWASAFWNAPRKTGQLASSIEKEVGEGEASIEVLAPYAVHVIRGTRPHLIRPVNASVLAFENANGKMIFSKLVQHPGTKANPFMQQAAQEALDKAEETFAKLWLEMLI
jgi:hypothetical protein